jgi:hypothetical protein
MRRKAEPRAVLTTCGLIVRGDTDDRPGDLIMTPVGLRHVHLILPPNAHATDDPACIQDELPLFFD